MSAMHPATVLAVGALLGRPEVHDLVRNAWAAGDLDFLVWWFVALLPWLFVFAVGFAVGVAYAAHYRIRLARMPSKHEQKTSRQSTYPFASPKQLTNGRH